MRHRMLWHTLLISSATAANLKPLVRGRGMPTPFYNITQPAASVTVSPSRTSPSGVDLPVTHIDNTASPVPERDSPSPVPSFIPSPPPTDCIDSVVTYTGAVPDTVFVTVDGSYEVTVTASNMSVTAPTIWETPRQACHTEVVADSDTPRVVQGPKGSSTRRPAAETVPMFSFIPPSDSPKPPPPPALLKETSTVVVTKKTPITVVEPATTTPPLSFGRPKTEVPSSPAGDVTTNQQNIGTVISSGSGSDGGGGNRGPSNNNSPAPSYTPYSGPTGGGSGGQGDTDSRLPPDQSAASGLASIIASVINSPFIAPTAPPPSQANQTPDFVAVPVTSTINGIPFTVGSSSLIIGSQTIALPTSSQQVVVVDSQTFVVGSDAIVGLSTTFQIQNQISTASTITQAPSVITTAGVTLTIGPSVAVISGTTYRIGTGAVSTLITVQGQTIGIGSEGVAFSGNNPTTFAPAMTIAGGYEIVVVGSLTISVDQTVAVISGTTFSIGAQATATTVTVGGTILTIGPSGVILPSTTIKPTSIPSISASITTSTSSASSRSTSSASVKTQSSGIGVRQMDLSNISSWFMAFLPLLFMSF